MATIQELIQARKAREAARASFPETSVVNKSPTRVAPEDRARVGSATPSGNAPSTSPRGQADLNTIEKTRPYQITIDGKPWQEFGRSVEEQDRAKEALHAQYGIPLTDMTEEQRASTAILLERSKTNRELEKPREEQDAGSLLVTTPVPSTGDFALDNAGKMRKSGKKAGPLGMSAAEILGEEEPEFFPDYDIDSREGMILQRSREGIDFRRGLPFFQRVAATQGSTIPSAQKHRIKGALAEQIENTPADIPALQWDPSLQQFYLALQIDEDDIKQGFENAENLGKYRYVSIDPLGADMGDIADMLSPAEVGGAVGSLIGPTGPGMKVAGKLIPLFTKAKAGGVVQNVLSSTSFATFGRLSGEALGIYLDHQNSNGEWSPTRDELVSLGFGSAGIELIGSILGEAGAAFLRGGSDTVQDAYAISTGRQGLKGTKEAVEEANQMQAKTREDLKIIRDMTGSSDYSVSRGQAMGSAHHIQKENSAFRTASQETKERVAADRFKADNATQDYIDNVWGGNLEVWEGRHGKIDMANAAYRDGNTVVTQAQDGLIGFHNKLDPSSHGLSVRPTDRDTWTVGAMRIDPSLRGVGAGGDLYKAAAREATAHGAALRSSSRMSPNAYKSWRGIDGSEEAGRLIWHPKAFLDDTIPDPDTGLMGMWTMPEELSHLPIVKMADVESFIPHFLTYTRVPARGTGGRIEANKEFAQFIRNPTPKVLSSVMKDVETNKLLRHDLKEAIYEDYLKNVRIVDEEGIESFSHKAFEKWKKDVGGFYDKVFSTKEILEINRMGGLRKVVDRSRQQASNLEESLAQTIDMKGELPRNWLRNPSAKNSVYNQLKNMPLRDLRRTTAFLRQADQLEDIQKIFNEELRQVIQKKTSGKTAGRQSAMNLEDFIGQNKELIEAMHPGSPDQARDYVQHLRRVSRMQERKFLRTALPGVAAEANPTTLAIGRVAFGPLSRKQRGFTAVRRWRMRRIGEAGLELISNPDDLASFMRISRLPMGHRQVTQVLPRLQGMQDMLDDLGVDWEDDDERTAFIQEIHQMQGGIDDGRE